MRILNESLEMVAVTKIQPHPDNPRLADIDVICKSIDANGFYGALVVQKSSGNIVGSHRYHAAMSRGATELPVHWVDCDDTTARRILLADNRTSDLAEYDRQLLDELKASLPGLEGTGYESGFEDDPMITGGDDREQLDCKHPIAPMAGEKYEYLMVLCTNDTDWTWMQQMFGLKQERSYKNSSVALGHAMRFAEFKKLWDQNQSKAK